MAERRGGSNMGGQHHTSAFEEEMVDIESIRNHPDSFESQEPRMSSLRPNMYHGDNNSAEYLPPAVLRRRGSGVDSIPDTPGGSRTGTPFSAPYGNHFQNDSRSAQSFTHLLSAPGAPPWSFQAGSHTSLGPPGSHASVATFMTTLGTPGSHQSVATFSSISPPPTIPSKEWVDSGAISRLNDRDDIDIWGGWRRYLFKLIPVVAFSNATLYLFYLALRIYCVVSAQRARGISYPGAWVFLSVEIAVAIPSQMHNFWTMWAMKKRNRPKLRLLGDEVPTIDVFVTCCGEDDEVVLDTVRGACDIDYPRDRFRVLVLDDGKSASLEAAISLLTMMYPNVYYIARKKYPGVPHHFKAGNLNNGLAEVDNLPGGPGEFMAALDADMIPEPDWLRAIIPHLLADPKMALACPPQLFYNTPPSDPLAQSLNFFVHVIEPIKDALGVAWCTGSGYIIRRKALDDIGNFPLGSLAEDVATSTMMLGKGWKTAYVHEPLQFGTVPEDYGSHLKQRTRWAIGTVQTAVKLNFCLWGKDVRAMTVAQRFSGFLYATLSLFTILVTMSLFAIPVVLLWGKPLIAFATLEQLKWLIWTCFAVTMSGRLCEFILFIPAGYQCGQRDFRYQLWMSPYLALSITRAFFLPRWLGGEVVAFKPTGSLGSALNERDPKLKKNMIKRMWAILFQFFAFFHLSFVYLTIAAVIMTSYKVFYEQKTFRDISLGLISHAFWPPLTFLFICSSLWTPISYAIDPPTMPDREDLLERDPKTGVAHPTAESKKIGFSGYVAWFELQYSIGTIWTCVVFAYSFFL